MKTNIEEKLVEEVSKTLLFLVKTMRDDPETKANSGVLKEAREWIKHLGIENPHPTKESETGKLNEELEKLPFGPEETLEESGRVH